MCQCLLQPASTGYVPQNYENCGCYSEQARTIEIFLCIELLVKFVPKCAQLFLASMRIVGVTLCLPLLAEGRKQPDKRRRLSQQLRQHSPVYTVLCSLPDDVFRNLERFTCLMYSSSTEQWSTCSEKNSSPLGINDSKVCFQRRKHHDSIPYVQRFKVAMFGDSRAKLNQHTHVRRNGDGRKLTVTGSLSGPLQMNYANLVRSQSSVDARRDVRGLAPAEKLNSNVLFFATAKVNVRIKLTPMITSDN